MHDLFIGLHIGNTANRLLLLSKRSLSAHLKPENCSIVRMPNTLRFQLWPVHAVLSFICGKKTLFHPSKKQFSKWCNDFVGPVLSGQSHRSRPPHNASLQTKTISSSGFIKSIYIVTHISNLFYASLPLPPLLRDAASELLVSNCSCLGNRSLWEGS